MFYKLRKSESGNVRDKNGVRYRLAECVKAYTPQGINVGYMEFSSREEALAHYNVEDIPEETDSPAEKTEL